MDALRAESAALTDGAASWHPAPGEWCVKEVLGHIIEAERRGFAGRVREFLAKDEPACVPWDQDVVARERKDCARPLGALVDELGALRADSAKLVEGLPAAALNRGGQHPKVGRLTVGDVVHGGCTTTAITSSRSWPMCRRRPGRTWAMPSASRRPDGAGARPVLAQRRLRFAASNSARVSGPGG